MGEEQKGKMKLVGRAPKLNFMYLEVLLFSLKPKYKCPRLKKEQKLLA
jgi:hypothetical protein